MAMIVPFDALFRDIRTNLVYEDQACTKRVGELRGDVLAHDDEPATPPTPPAEPAPPVVEPRIVIKEYYHAEVMDQLLKAPAEVISNKDRAMLKKYHNARVRDSVPSYVEVLYKERPVVSRVSMGRRYPAGPSLQAFPSQIRSALGTGMVEIDQKNSHPHIALVYMKKHGLPHHHMEHYINNREEVLQSIHTDRAVAKEAVLKVLFGSKDVPGALTGLASELSTLAKCIHQIGGEYLWTKEAAFLKEMAEASKQDPEMPPAYKSDPKVRGLAYLLQTEETRISDAIALFCADQGVQVTLRLHDGVFVRGDVDDAFLRAAEAHITATTGYDMPLGTKPCKCTLELAALGSTKTISHETSAKAFFDVFSDRFLVTPDDTVWVFDARSGVWKIPKDFAQIVLNMTTERRLVDPTFLEAGRHGQSMVSMRPVASHVKSFVDMVCREELKLETTKVLFSNGIYDPVTRTLSPFDPAIKFIRSTGYPYTPTPDHEQWRKTALYTDHATAPFEHEGRGEAGEYLFNLIATSIFGGYMLQNFVAIEGPTSTGKGTLSTALKHVLGGFQGTWSLNSILVNSSTQDDARRNAMFILTEGCRVAFANEAKASTDKVDTNFIKMMASGGDEVVCRTHQTGERIVRATTTFFTLVNAFPVIDNADSAVRKRLKIIKPTTEFHNDCDTNPAAEDNWRNADPSMRNRFEDDKDHLWKCAFFDLLVDMWHRLPASVRAAKTEIPMPPYVRSTTNRIFDDASFETLLEKYGYEKTANETDYVFQDELHKLLEEDKYSVPRIGNEMRALLKGFAHGEKIQGRRVYRGLVRRHASVRIW